MQHVVATAGHVDHGKSTLVRALTGIEPDRLAEEQRRGLTIDLGYGWTDLPSGETVAFVDVPGHERFITTMLAGVGPVPAVLFVVAADGGWSAQSSEHLAVLDALGVSHGVLAITRSDLGDGDLAAEEARGYLRGTSLEGIEAVSVSAVTGAGLSTLAGALERMVTALPQAPTDRTRLWVDRIFSVHGAGTVVTGTLASGRVTVGEVLEVTGSEPVRVRAIETLKEPVEIAEAVSRVALNLRGVRTDAIQRGMALTGSGDWPTVTTMDVRLTPTGQLPDDVIFHIGSAAIPTRLRRLGDHTARLTLARAVPVVIGERGVLRDPGSRRVVAATVLDPMPPPLRRRGAAAARDVVLAGRPTRAGMAAEVGERGAGRRADLALIGAISPGEVPVDGVVERAGWLVDVAVWGRWRHALTDTVSAWAAAHPMRPGMSREALADQLELPDVALVDALVDASDEIVADAAGVHPRGVDVRLPAEVEASLTELLSRLEAHPFDAADANELAAAGLSDRFLAIAVQDGRLLRIAEGIYLRAEAIEEAVNRLRALPPGFTVAAAREAWGTTRRVAVPLLEHLDRRRLTRRLDDRLREVR